jgi:hypothetical protein
LVASTSELTHAVVPAFAGMTAMGVHRDAAETRREQEEGKGAHDGFGVRPFPAHHPPECEALLNTAKRH